MTEITYGDKYEATKGLHTAELAKLVRADIKAAVAKGELPPAPTTYSVRIKRFSGGSSIDVSVKGELPFPSYELGESHGWFTLVHTEESQAIIKKLKAIIDAYNYDGSDIQTDYFNVRFYGDAEDRSDSGARQYKELSAHPLLNQAFDSNTDEGQAILRRRCEKWDREHGESAPPAPPVPPAPAKVEPEPAASEPAATAPVAPVLRLVKPEAEVPAPSAPVPVEAPPSAARLALAALIGDAEATALLSTYGSLRALARSPDAPQAVRTALRFARALDAESGLPTATDAGTVAAYYAPRIGDSTTERFHALLLDSANHVLRDVEIVRGGLTSCSVLPREAFSQALREGAVAVIFAHNHPSGATSPSADDIALTRKLVEAGGILGIKVLDHVIVGAGFTSLRERQPSLFA